MEPRGLCLADTGAQYLEGTTDITRTIALGTLTEEEKTHLHACPCADTYSWARPSSCNGCMGENLGHAGPHARCGKRGLDFNHGTGHGVGFVLGVHEALSAYTGM